jgi:hypothetical protein
MHYVILFLTGAFLCNAIPHLAAGLLGMPFPTPFAKPRGIGHSSPLVNFLWGSLNLVLGLAGIIDNPFVLGANLDSLVLAIGVLVLGAFCSVHFGKVRSGELS